MMTPLQRILIIVVTLICASVVANAVTLQAKVVEVQSGNVLVVSNINRSIRVRLKSVVPPEAGQPFDEAAREHLKALVFDKTVTVEYTHLADGCLDAKVFLNGIDIGSQMLRDGAAWYDHATDYELSDGDRDLYAQCELAARTEKRGLWKDESALAPWEYRRIQRAKAEGMLNRTYESISKSKAAKQETVLSNQDLMMGGVGGLKNQPTRRRIAEYGSFDRWTNFESPQARFSVMIPSDAMETLSTGVDTNGLPVSYDILTAGSYQALFMVVSGKGANEDRADDERILDQSIESLIAGMNDSVKKTGKGDLLALKPVRAIKLGGYPGKQYSLEGKVFSGTARVFTKSIGEERRVLVAIALNRPGSEDLSSQFLNSFKILQ